MSTLEQFAAKVQEDQRNWYKQQFPDTFDGVHKLSWQASIKPGKKYTKVDVGSSGKFMIDEDGNIFGIKGYGVIHRGKHYGTLDTIDNYFWGYYYPLKHSKHAQRPGQYGLEGGRR